MKKTAAPFLPTSTPTTASPPLRPTMHAGEWAQLLFLSVLWGGSFFFNKVALRELPPLTIMLARAGIAALVLHAVLRSGGLRMPRTWQAWLPFFFMGAFNSVIPQSLILWGQTEISSGLAAILNATTPLFTVLLAHLVTRDERLTRGKVGGVLLGLLGVIVLIGPGALAGLSRNLLAEVAILGASLSYAIAVVFSRRFHATSPYVTAAGQLSAATILVLPLSLMIDQPWKLPLPSAATWGALAGLALISTSLAYIIYFRLIASAGSTNASLVTLLIPASAILLGVLFLGENLAPAAIVGIAFIALGLLTIDGRVLRRAGLRRALPKSAEEPS